MARKAVSPTAVLVQFFMTQPIEQCEQLFITAKAIVTQRLFASMGEVPKRRRRQPTQHVARDHMTQGSGYPTTAVPPTTMTPASAAPTSAIHEQATAQSPTRRPSTRVPVDERTSPKRARRGKRDGSRGGAVVGTRVVAPPTSEIDVALPGLVFPDQGDPEDLGHEYEPVE